MADYDDYRPTSELTWTSDGKTITRTIYIRALDEIEAHQHVDAPQRGDAIDLSDSSGVNEYLYCTEVDVAQIAEAAADDDQNFLFEVTATYSPLGGRNPTPVEGKATWKVGFRPQQILIREVDNNSDQTHYAPGSGAEDWKPVTTGINDTQEGPQGVQIDEMVEALQIEFWKNPSDVEDYLDDVRSIVNKTNNAAFEGPWGSYAAGEARITGLDVIQNGEDITSVSVEISRSRNRSGISVSLDNGGGTSVSVDKDGWQYLWVRWIKSIGPTDSEEKVLPRRIDAHVATVYESGDFGLLGVTDDIWS